MSLIDDDDDGKVIICKWVYYENGVPVGKSVSTEPPPPANRVVGDTVDQPLSDDDPVYGEDGWGSSAR